MGLSKTTIFLLYLQELQYQTALRVYDYNVPCYFTPSSGGLVVSTLLNDAAVFTEFIIKGRCLKIPRGSDTLWHWTTLYIFPLYPYILLPDDSWARSYEQPFNKRENTGNRCSHIPVLFLFHAHRL